LKNIQIFSSDWPELGSIELSRAQTGRKHMFQES